MACVPCEDTDLGIRENPFHCGQCDCCKVEEGEESDETETDATGEVENEEDKEETGEPVGEEEKEEEV